MDYSLLSPTTRIHHSHQLSLLSSPSTVFSLSCPRHLFRPFTSSRESLWSLPAPPPCHEALICRASSSQRQWLEYKEAVQTSDIAKALRVLETLNTFESDGAVGMEEDGGNRAAVSVENGAQDFQEVKDVFVNKDLDVAGQQRGDILRVLDACQSASDLNLVAKAYEVLVMLGLIPNFGKYKSYAFEGATVVTPALMMSSAGLEASKLSPKKWGLSGNSALLLGVCLGVFSYLVNSGIELRPLAAAALGLGFVDAIYLGGSGLGQILSLWLPYKQRVIVHEAGHILVAYLLGCPVRGVVLDAIQALRMGIKGQAGTQFWDQTLEKELCQGQLTTASLNRYFMVLFAGIAAEALVYGEAEGGENDENLYKAIVSQLKPPWSPAKMSNQARWAVLESYKLLKENKGAHDAVIRALETGENMSNIVTSIEDVMASRSST